MSKNDVGSGDCAIAVREALRELFQQAEGSFSDSALAELSNTTGNPHIFDIAIQLSKIKHASRGIALTLAAYKCVVPTQDIRIHKSEYEGGFSARSIDSAVTVPFLQTNSLPYNVETHWLSQTFSFSGPYTRSQILKTTPKSAGPILIELVNLIEESENQVEVARTVVILLFMGLIDERNRGRVALTKPKELVISQVVALLEGHFHETYSKNAPRLPQLALYAIYKCICRSMERYKNFELQPLERMKAANRKSGSVGDIDIHMGEQPIEAVEIKHGIPISVEHVAEAIQKIKHASVERYLILSTAGIDDDSSEEIERLISEFKRTNGCEIIVNGVSDTIRYYLRLIRSPNDFIFEYTSLVEFDEDLSYEHKLAWNAICETLLS